MKEITEKSLLRFFKIIGIFFGVYILYALFFTSQEERDESYLEATYNYEFHGVVTDKYIDKANHNTNTLVLKNGKKVGSDNELYDFAQVNDSVSKSTGALEIQVFRKPDAASQYVLIKEVYGNNVIRKRALLNNGDTLQDFSK